VLFLASVFISFGGEQVSIQESYDILVNLTILIYFVPYLYLFAAWIRLRRAESSRPDLDVMTMARGMAGVWLVAGCGFIATFVAIGLVFVPPPGTASVLSYQANLVGQALLLFAIGGVLYLAARRRAGS
jgi:amino acid transporter